MTREIANRKAAKADDRLRRFTEIDRKQAEEGSHPATRAAALRASAANSGRGVVEFARIARGRTA